MSEEEARAGVTRIVSRETYMLLARYVQLLRDASTSQNLISATTLKTVWLRHILDSVQLGDAMRGDVIDIGSGAGLPGIVLASMGLRVTLVEPRRLRAAFLAEAVRELNLSNVLILPRPASSVQSRHETITARALAPLDRVFAMTVHLALPTSRWVLPKGRMAHAELEVARRAWHGRFELVQSITDPSGMIVVAEQLRPRAGQ